MSKKKSWRDNWRDKVKKEVRTGNGKLKREEIEAFLTDAKEACNSNDPKKMAKSNFYASRLMCSWLYSLDGRVEGWETMLMAFMDSIEEHIDTAAGFKAGLWKGIGIVSGIVMLAVVVLGALATFMGAIKFGG